MKESLRSLLDTCQPPPPDPTAKAALLATVRSLPRRGLTPRAFLAAQLGFIRPAMWAAQAGLLGLAALMIRSAQKPEQLYLMLGTVLPVLLVVNAAELMRVYNGGMLELELATRYTLSEVCAARMLLFGLTDSAVVLTSALLGAAATRAPLLTLLLYCLTPFTLLCAGCLAAMRLSRPDLLPWDALLLCLCAAAVLILGRGRLYLPEYRPLWLAALLLAAALVWGQKRALFQKGVFSCKL